MIKPKVKQSGFTLLLTLIVVGAVVSIGLTILDLSIKQLELSTNSKDSEVAFHAANAGMECAQYHRNVKSSELEGGDSNVEFDCFGSSDSDSPDNISFSENSFDPDNSVYKYVHEFSWGAVGAERCTEITSVVLNSATGITVAGGDLMSEIPGYPNSDKYCDSGGRCTIVSVRGYSRTCGSKGDHGTIQREVLVEF